MIRANFNEHRNGVALRDLLPILYWTKIFQLVQQVYFFRIVKLYTTQCPVTLSPWIYWKCSLYISLVYGTIPEETNHNKCFYADALLKLTFKIEKNTNEKSHRILNTKETKNIKLCRYLEMQKG